MTDQQHTEAGLFALVGERRVRGLLVPYREPSRLNVSGIPPISFDRGTVAIPRDPSVVGLNLQHDRYNPVGRAVAFEDTDAGIVADFAIADTEEGDAYLANPGARKLSPELAGIIREGERGTAARITGAAIVTEGAFASAGLFALGDVTETESVDAAATTDGDHIAVDAESLPIDVTVTTPDDSATYVRAQAEQDDDETTDAAFAASDTEPAAPANPEEDAVTAATAQGFAAAQPSDTAPATPGASFGDFAAAIAHASRTHDNSRLLAITEPERNAGLFALADARYDATATDAGRLATPQYLGEIFAGTAYAEQYIGQFASAPLTELRFKSRAWAQKPLVDKWSGNKTEIPSRVPQFAVVEKAAQRFAGGLDIAREYYDFGHTDDVQAILTAMAESFRENADRYVGDEIRGAATPLEVDIADKPSDVSEAMFKLVRGALAVRRQGKTLPTVAYIADDLYEQLLFTVKNGGLEYLSTALGLDSGTVAGFGLLPDENLDAGQVLVAARPAVTVLQLPGSPIRVNALDIARGGVDEAMFGYVGVDVQRAEALQLVSTAA